VSNINKSISLLFYPACAETRNIRFWITQRHQKINKNHRDAETRRRKESSLILGVSVANNIIYGTTMIKTV